jgi:hypothetical protein
VEPFLKSLEEIQPSQLYISSEKLHRVLAGLGESVIESIEPIPIRRLDGRSVYTDGHTRAFAAYLHGSASIPVYWDEDELDWEAYEICVGWCLVAGITSIGDLVGRVIAPELHEVLWLERCAKMRRELRLRRSERPGMRYGP